MTGTTDAGGDDIERISVVIADDHAVVRQGIRSLLGTITDIEVIAEAATGDDAVAFSAARGHVILGPGAAERLLERLSAPTSASVVFPQLTERERDVLRLVANGHNNTAIAHSLNRAPKAIANHVSNILTKLQIADEEHRPQPTTPGERLRQDGSALGCRRSRRGRGCPHPGNGEEIYTGIVAFVDAARYRFRITGTSPLDPMCSRVDEPSAARPGDDLDRESLGPARVLDGRGGCPPGSGVPGATRGGVGGGRLGCRGSRPRDCGGLTRPPSTCHKV